GRRRAGLARGPFTSNGACRRKATRRGSSGAVEAPPVGQGLRRQSMAGTGPTRIVILGGGFGGVYTALTLEKLLRRELDRGEVERGLISRDNYIVFQPMRPEANSGSIGIVDTVSPTRRRAPPPHLYTRAL